MQAKVSVDTFSSENIEENMQEYLENGFSTEKLNMELTELNTKFYLVEKLKI